MSETTCTPGFAQQSYNLPQRRPSSQIAPDEIVLDRRTEDEASELLDSESHCSTNVTETPHRPQGSLARLRKSISGLQDLIVVVSTCSANSVLSRLRPRRKRSPDVAVEDLSGATQPKRRRDMIAEKIAARQKEKAAKKEMELQNRMKALELELLDEIAVARMKKWSWPDAASSSMADDSAISQEGEWYSEHGSD